MDGDRRRRRLLQLIPILGAAAVIAVRGLTTVDLAGVDWLVVVVILVAAIPVVALLTIREVRRIEAARTDAPDAPADEP